jgi:hypothetical protein
MNWICTWLWCCNSCSSSQLISVLKFCNILVYNIYCTTVGYRSSISFLAFRTRLDVLLLWVIRATNQNTSRTISGVKSKMSFFMKKWVDYLLTGPIQLNILVEEKRLAQRKIGPSNKRKVKPNYQPTWEQPGDNDSSSSTSNIRENRPALMVVPPWTLPLLATAYVTPDGPPFGSRGPGRPPRSTPLRAGPDVNVRPVTVRITSL